MFHSLAVKNYRCLKDLEIDSLERVNLIVGMNNTGKSSLLEAVALYASKGDLSFILQLLEDHGEFAKYEEGKQKTRNLENITAKTLASLFTDRQFGFHDENAIVIGSVGDVSQKSTLSMRFVVHRYRFTRDEVSKEFGQIRIPLPDEEASHAEAVDLAMEINESGDIRHLFFDPFGKNKLRDWSLRELKTSAAFQFVKAGTIEGKTNGSLFDNIALTSKEAYLLEAVRIIDPAIDGIAFAGERGRRAAVVKLSGADSTVPLRSMGDGINRILTIVLALINAENGFLLIDEFENGLYHIAQKQLWKMIFLLAEKLNVQVFATTHSEDCIRGFVRVLNASENQTTGKLVRLEKKKGVIRSVAYNKKELQIADEQDIEVR